MGRGASSAASLIHLQQVRFPLEDASAGKTMASQLLATSYAITTIPTVPITPVSTCCTLSGISRIYTAASGYIIS